MISGAQWFMRLRGLERDPEKGLKHMIVSCTTCCRKFSTNMMVIVFCTSPDSMYPGILAHAMGERGRLSAPSADSSLPPHPAEKIRIRTSSGAEGGYLRAVRREVSRSGSR